MTYQQLDLTHDRAERIRYDWPDLPVYARKSSLSVFRNMAASSHWHSDVEFMVLLDGHMEYDINGETVHIGEGEGLFVNSRQLHYGFSGDGTDCQYLCLVMHPLTLCVSQQMAKAYVSPVLENESAPYCLLRPDHPWQGKAMAQLKRIYEACAQRKELAELEVMSAFYELWALLYGGLPHAEQPVRANKRLAALRAMVSYVQAHYGDRVTTQQIAQAGHMCQTSCCTAFAQYLHQTPIQYLIGYRLSRSAELLLEPGESVTEVAFACGFSSVSYFTETFRKRFGCPPTEYRRRAMAEDGASGV